MTHQSNRKGLRAIAGAWLDDDPPRVITKPWRP